MTEARVQRQVLASSLSKGEALLAQSLDVQRQQRGRIKELKAQAKEQQGKAEGLESRILEQEKRIKELMTTADKLALSDARATNTREASGHIITDQPLGIIALQPMQDPESSIVSPPHNILSSPQPDASLEQQRVTHTSSPLHLPSSPSAAKVHLPETNSPPKMLQEPKLDGGDETSSVVDGSLLKPVQGSADPARTSDQSRPWSTIGAPTLPPSDLAHDASVTEDATLEPDSTTAVPAQSMIKKACSSLSSIPPDAITPREGRPFLKKALEHDSTAKVDLEPGSKRRKTEGSGESPQKPSDVHVSQMPPAITSHVTIAAPIQTSLPSTACPKVDIMILTSPDMSPNADDEPAANSTSHHAVVSEQLQVKADTNTVCDGSPQGIGGKGVPLLGIPDGAPPETGDACMEDPTIEALHGETEKIRGGLPLLAGAMEAAIGPAPASGEDMAVLAACYSAPSEASGGGGGGGQRGFISSALGGLFSSFEESPGELE